MCVRCCVLRELPRLYFLNQNILRNSGCINRDTGLSAGSSLHCTFSLRPCKSSSWTHPSSSLQKVSLGICQVWNSWACCQEQLMISCNGLCLKNIWMETKSVNLPDVSSTGHSTARCFRCRQSPPLHRQHLYFGVCFGSSAL